MAVFMDHCKEIRYWGSEKKYALAGGDFFIDAMRAGREEYRPRNHRGGFFLIPGLPDAGRFFP